MFVTGPKVVKSVTGEDISIEDLGGADVHAGKSGVSHFKVESEEEGLLLIRKLLSYLPQNNLEEAPIFSSNDPIDRLEDSLNEIIPDNPNHPYDMKNVIHAIVDNSGFGSSRITHATSSWVLASSAHLVGYNRLGPIFGYYWMRLFREGSAFCTLL